MRAQPCFETDPAAPQRDDSIALAVYAPFGSDPTLSHYPGDKPRPVLKHPLVRALARVASLGIHVHALIDLVGDDSYVVEFDAGRTTPNLVSAWKQDMASPRALAGFLRHVRRHRPCASIVLALEGHGAGFLPELDTTQLSTQRVTDGGAIEWHTTAGGSNPLLPTGSPILPTGSPILPTGSPILPAGPLPMSTWGLGEALRLATERGRRPLSVIHFNNCFNLSVEVLHTVAPYAGHAAGYCNYNFFTAGETYPTAFAQWLAKGPRTAHGLAQWFARANHAKLKAKGHHPTIGGVVALSRVRPAVHHLDRLARELTRVLAVADPLARKAERDRIQAAIVQAQQYDTVPFALEIPDQLTDLASLAHALLAQPFTGNDVHRHAKALLAALQGIKAYGDTDTPWVDLGVTWDFSAAALAMNIFLPDPGLQGVWDWRSPYYLQRTSPAGKPPIQPQVIEFLEQTGWVEFLIEYHKAVPFVGLLPALAPRFPVFRARFDPKNPGGDGGSRPGKPGGPSGPTQQAGGDRQQGGSAGG